MVSDICALSSALGINLGLIKSSTVKGFLFHLLRNRQLCGDNRDGGCKVLIYLLVTGRWMCAMSGPCNDSWANSRFGYMGRGPDGHVNNQRLGSTAAYDRASARKPRAIPKVRTSESARRHEQPAEVVRRRSRPLAPAATCIHPERPTW
jgi:hypothetical protein